jgi:hypothetical protein
MSQQKLTPTTKRQEEKKEDKVEENLDDWMKRMYDISDIKEEDLQEIYQNLRYKGFDRVEVLRELARKFPEKSLFTQAVIVCALQGPRRASLIKLSGGKSLSEMGVQASGMKGARGLSCARITAATADLAAYYLKRLNVPKKVQVDCPAWLQFPSAGSISLPRTLRDQHREFSAIFSTKIKGEFNEDIYSQMEINAYYKQELNLF